MIRGERLRASWVAIALPALAIVALTALAWSGAPGRSKLEQVGEDEFLNPLNSETSADMAAKIQGILKKEAVLLKKIGTRAKLREHVQIDVTAGQIGIVGPKGFKGYTGVAGFQGPRGNTGRRGRRGPRGPEGPPGIKGVKGADGDPGAHGAVGSTGRTGPSGPRGRRGRAGPRGPEGPIGKNGANGPPGNNGPSGDRGRSVYEGSPGIMGKRGLPGLRGRAGDPGAPGDRGMTGKQGLPGSNGAPGIPGPPGKDGKSVCTTGNTAGQGMCCGSVPAKKWVKKSDFSMQATIDMSKCDFIEGPMIFSSIDQVTRGYKSLNSESNIINTGYDEIDNRIVTVEIRSELEMTASRMASMAGSWGWNLKWCAFGTQGSTAAGKKRPTYEVCCGSSNSNWEDFDSTTLTLPVDTSGCGWDNGPAGAPNRAPTYFTSLSDSTCGSELFKTTPRCAARTIGYQSIYKPTNKKFQVYARPIPGMKMPTKEKAKEYNWQINWCAVKPYVPNKAAKAGFPCTSPRLLKGSGSQTAFTDYGSICCDTTSSGGWASAGSDSIKKVIDISACKFSKVSYLMTNVRGERISTVVHFVFALPP
jgi:hypothetical protein